MQWKLVLALVIVVVGVPSEANLITPHVAVEVEALKLPVREVRAETRSITEPRVHTPFWQTSDDDGWIGQ